MFNNWRSLYLLERFFYRDRNLKSIFFCKVRSAMCSDQPIFTLNLVNLQVFDQNIDTSDATIRLLLNMLGTIAQKEKP